MHLKKAESDRFYRLIYLVEDYVASVDEAILDDPDAPERGDDPRETGATQLELPGFAVDDMDDRRRTLRALAFVSDVPEVIDWLIEDEDRLAPGLLDAKDKRILRQWREGAWEVEATLLGHAENGNALLDTPMGVVEVCGITQEFSDFAMDIPSMLSTVLLPFGERITYGCTMLGHPIEYGPNASEMLEERMRAVRDGELKPIATVPAYVKRLRPYREEKREKAFAELERQLDREAHRTMGEEPRVEGVHRGVLADMDEEEREAAIEADMDEMLNDASEKDRAERVLEFATKRSIEGKPPSDLRTALAEFDEDRLNDFALYVEVPHAAENKTELIETVVEAFEDPNAIREFLYLSHPFEYQNFMDVVDAGGRVVVDERDVERLPKLHEWPPFLFLYHDASEGTFVNVVYEEARKGLEAIGRDDVEQTRNIVAEVNHYAELAAQLYGLVSVKEFMELYPFPEDGTPSLDEFSALLDRILCYQDREYRLEKIDGTLYIAEPFLSTDFITDGGLDPLPSGFAESQHYILERQRVVPRRPLTDVIDASSLYDWTLDLESGRALRDWLDAHVPDDDSDFTFAERVMEELYERVRMFGKPTDAADLIADCYGGLVFDDDPLDFYDEAIGMFCRFVNDIPLWQNHGYSSTGLHERETGRRQFFNPDGTPMKVGRNDPCPCGSGKKYKNCCGRPKGARRTR